MTTSKLIQDIRQHEDNEQLGAFDELGFAVREACEIADGVVAVCDTVGRYARSILIQFTEA